MYAIMIHRIFVSIIIVVVSCCKICDAFVVKPYLQTNSLQKKHSSNRVNNNIKHSYSSSKLDVVNNNRGIELSNVFYDDTDMAFSAWEWQNGLGEICCIVRWLVYDTPTPTANICFVLTSKFLFFQSSLGAPAALIAGAVLVTLMETREDYAPKSTDSKWVRVGKLLYRFLLASSFGLEVVSIFVSTVTV